MLYSTVLVALLAAIYVYYLTKKRFMLVVILGQLFFLAGLISNHHLLRAAAHTILYFSVIYGTFLARHIYVLGYILATAVFTLLTRVFLKKCAFRLAPAPPSCTFPPKWLPLPPINLSLVLVSSILMARIYSRVYIK